MITVEETAQTGSVPTDELGVRALDSLARAARQVTFYGTGHPLSATALASACGQLHATSGGADITIEADADHLLWNGTPLARRVDVADHLLRLMRDRLISRIEITPEVTEHEVQELLRVLATEPDELRSAGGAGKLLAASGVGSIRLGEYDFSTQLAVPEAVWREICDKLAPQEANALRGILRSCSVETSESDADHDRTENVVLPESVLGERNDSDGVAAAGIAQLIQQSGESTYYTDREGWERWRSETASQLSQLPAHWRALIFRAQTRRAIDYPDMLGLIAAELSDEECVSAVFGYSQPLQAERSAGLKLVLQRVLADENRRESLQEALREEARRKGIPDSIYENVVELLIAEITGRADSVLAKTREHGPDSAAELNRKVALDIDDLLLTLVPEQVSRSRLRLLRECIAAPLTSKRYEQILDLLVTGAEQRVAHRDADGLLIALSTLEDETRKSAQDRIRSSSATNALARAATESTLSFLASAIRGREKDITTLFGRLGPVGLQELSKLTLLNDVVVVQFALAALVTYDSAQYPHLRQVLSCIHGTVLTRALGYLIDASAAHPVSATRLAHAFAEVPDDTKVAFAQLLVQRRRADLAPVIIPWVRDDSSAVAVAAIEAIPSLGAQEATPQLIELLRLTAHRREKALIREAVCKTLGGLRAQEAVPALCEVLRGGGFISKLTPSPLRTAAAAAIAEIGGSEAQLILTRGANSLLPGLRKACASALRQPRIQSGERSTHAS